MENRKTFQSDGLSMSRLDAPGLLTAGHIYLIFPYIKRDRALTPKFNSVSFVIRGPTAHGSRILRRYQHWQKNAAEAAPEWFILLQYSVADHARRKRETIRTPTGWPHKPKR